MLVFFSRNYAMFLFLVILALLGLLTQVHAQDSLSQESEAFLRQTDPRHLTVLDYAKINDLNDQGLITLCEDIIAGEGEYRAAVVELLNGGSCQSFIDNKINPLIVDFNSSIAELEQMDSSLEYQY